MTDPDSATTTDAHDASDATDALDPGGLPIVPTSAPSVFRDRDVLPGLFADVLDRLAVVVDIHDDRLHGPTPCAGFDVAQLRRHVLGWLQFFAVALDDPAGGDRPDPDAVELGDRSASDLVRAARADIEAAIAAGVADELVTMTNSRMRGDGVLAMALGEYVVHGWDLATATGRPYGPPTAAIEPALAFLQGMVAPEHRGPDSGFFDVEVPVPADAPPLDRLLGFTGRDPGRFRAST